MKKLELEFERVILQTLLDKELISESEFLKALEYIATKIYGRKNYSKGRE